MKTTSSSIVRPGGAIRLDEREVGAIHSLEKDQSEVLGADLSNTEHELSVPPVGPPPRHLQALGDILGKSVTIGNIAWTSAALPDMRALQKALVEQSLKQDKGERADCLAAILVVEEAVKLRLRLQQMHENDAELAMATDGGKGK